MSAAWWLASVVVAASDVPLRSEEPRALALSEVVSASKELFPTLLAASADVDAADGERLSASGAFDPVWRTRAWAVPASAYPQVRVDTVVEAPTPLWGTTFFGGYRLGVGKFQAYYGERETWSGGELRAGAIVPVLRNGPIDRRRASEARAVLGQAIAGLTREQQELEVVRAATHRYWEWVAAGRRRDIARALLEIARQRDGQLAARSQAGDVARFDRQDNTRAVVQREALLVQTQRGLEQAAFELSIFLRNASGEPRMPGEDELPAFPEPSATAPLELDEVLARRPDVRRLVDQKKAAEIELKFQQNQLLPALDLGVVVSGDLGTPNTSSLSPLGPAELEFSAVLDVPVLYRAPLGRIQSARALVARLDHQLRLARDRVKIEVGDAESALSAATQRVVLARQEVEVALELERGERKRFELGDSSLLFVNLREQTTAEARLREIDALLDVHRAVASQRAAAALR